jgi:hypothetical protein
MEWIPKFLDALDSAVYALSLVWLGYQGRTCQEFLWFSLGCSGLIFIPVVRVLSLAALASFLCAELLYRLTSSRLQAAPAR